MTNTGKILILKLYDKLLSMLIRDNQILSIQAQKKDSYAVGNIYVGKIQNISANIGAAFVDLGGGYLTFLPMTEAKDAYVTNRRMDGTLKIGDEVLVQIVKEPIKTKLAGVTARISLSGTYVVAGMPRYACTQVPTSSVDMIDETTTATSLIQVSSKLSKKQQMKFRSMEALQKIAETCPLIIRTNAGELEEIEALLAEAESLSETLCDIVEIADKRTCYSCLYQGKPDYVNFVQNTYHTEYDEVVTDLPEVYEVLQKEMSNVLSGNDKALRLYEDARLPLYKLYSVETRVKELLDKKVWLKSGGYLVIEPTEALISIDVNTGKCEKGKNKEETSFQINMEAAEMIALQLRARNLSGMILVDFINLKKKEHESRLMEYMKSLLRRDSVTASVVDMTGLGLMELTRKKVSPSFAEQMK